MKLIAKLTILTLVPVVILSPVAHAMMVNGSDYAECIKMCGRETTNPSDRHTCIEGCRYLKFSLLERQGIVLSSDPITKTLISKLLATS